MIAFYHRELRYLLPALLSMFVAGCSTPSTQYYVLNSVLPEKLQMMAETLQEKSTQKGAVQQVVIRQIEIPRYLDRPRIVSRDADNHLRISEYHQWGGRLRDDVARTLSDNLAERLDSIDVLTAPFPGSMHADVSLLIDIRQFELLSDGRMHLKVRWHVQRTGSDSQSYVDHMISESDMDDHDYAAMAAAMSKLLALLSEKMVVVIKSLSPLDSH